MPPYAATERSKTAFAFANDSVVRLCGSALDATIKSMATMAIDFVITFLPYGFLIFTISGIRL
jgi:hypothetical protein